MTRKSKVKRSLFARRGRRLSWHTTWQLRRKSRAKQTLSANDSYLFRELQGGDIALDCGANVGDITDLMARRGARVHAFEPDPHAYEALARRFEGAANVTCHNVAVASQTGTTKLYFREEHETDPMKYSVGSTLDPRKTDVNPNSFATVEVVSLSDFLRVLPRVRLLKLDIEGSEVDVLESLLVEDLLERVDLTLVETHEEWIPELAPRLEAIKKEVQRRDLRHVYFNWI